MTSNPKTLSALPASSGWLSSNIKGIGWMDRQVRNLYQTLKMSSSRKSDVIFKLTAFGGVSHTCPHDILSVLDVEQEIAFYTNDTME